MNKRVLTLIEVLIICGALIFILYLGGIFTPTPPTTSPTLSPNPTRTSFPNTVTPTASNTPSPANTFTPAPPTPTFLPRTTPFGLIAFESNRDGNTEIYIMNADGSNPHNLTNNPANDYWPSWSPDGSRIAFFSLRTGWQEIYIMNADGSNTQQLTNSDGTGTAYQLPLTWSPDGKIILAMRQGVWTGHSALTPILDAIDTSEPGTQNLLGLEGPYSWFQSWSLHSPKIILLMQSKLDYSDCRAYTATVEQTLTDLRMLVSQCRPIVGSPDGKQYAYSDTDIYIFDMDGTKLRRLNQIDQANGSLAWSPNGNYILYQTSTNVRYRVAYSNGAGLLPVLIYASSPIPSWAPDSNWLVYADSKIDNSSDIYRVNLFDQNASTQLTDSGNNYSPVWQPVP